jgi:hypothetical protein
MLELTDGDAEVLKVQYETLQTFKSRIDGVISKLESSPASPKTVGRDRVAAGHLGKGFAEAEALTATYNHVHDQLETFSGLLADQMEAMRIAVEGARVGYQNVDEEQRRKMWTIYRRTQKWDQRNDPTGQLPPEPGTVCPAGTTPTTTAQDPSQGSVGGFSG